MARRELPAQEHSPTSLAAAIRYAEHAEQARERVHRLLYCLPQGGLTDEQIQDALRMSANTERPRRIELQRAGLVVDTGQTRPTRSGAQAVIWAASSQKYAHALFTKGGQRGVK